jgi:hypothetical protein
MSVQLILYPQKYDGSFSATTTQQTSQYVADNILFNGVIATSVHNTTSTNPTNHAVINNPATIGWKRFRTNGGSWGTPDAPTIAGQLILDSDTTISQSGVYQLITNLTIGQEYDIKINITQAASGGTILLHTSPNTWVDGGSTTQFTTGLEPQITLGTTASTGTLTQTFEAQHQSEVLIVTYQNDSGAAIKINKISITENINSAPLVTTEVADGQVICDLYKDESIPLSLSVDNFKNAAEKVQSYSKSFNLPATKRNNKIFTHLFEITTTQDAYSFNPYIKTQAILKEDSYSIFEGYLRLIEIVNKKGEISYNVNLYSEQISLKETLDARTFADIDLRELDHNYHRTNITNSWYDSTGLALTNSLSTDSFAYNSSIGVNNTNVLKYPFCDWTGNLFVNASGNLELTNVSDAFRPFIQVKYLIDKILDDAGFTFTSNFFNTANFKRLFMDFNWGEGNAPQQQVGTNYIQAFFNQSTSNAAGTSYTTLKYTTFTGTVGAGYNASTGVFTAQQNGIEYDIIYWNEFETSGTITETQCRWVHKDSSGNVKSEIDLQTVSSAAAFWYGSFTVVLDINETLTPQFKKTGAGTFAQSTTTNVNVSNVNATTSITAIASQGILNTNRGKLKQYDFLKGIFTMFNLVAIQDKDNPKTLQIEPYADIFINPSNAGLTSTQHDWTSKVDASQIKLHPLKNLKRQTNFTYKEDSNDYCVGVYANAMGGYLYGTKTFDASGLTLLEGEDTITVEPFAPTISRPVTTSTNFSEMIVPAIYGGEKNDNKGYNNLPRILYNVSGASPDTMANATYLVPSFNGVLGANLNNLLQFSHLSEIGTTSDTLDYNFGECPLVNPIGNPTINNLFNTYWLPYYEELYNPDTRIMKVKVYLTPSDINGFKFYDTVIIKNREYRVNKIDYKSGELATVEFILI